MKKWIIFLSVIMAGCTKATTVPVCPFGAIYLTENDVVVISDLLVDEILAYNEFCDGGIK